MEADVILESPERRIILDTKFYRDALGRGRGSGAGKLHSNNQLPHEVKGLPSTEG